MRKTTLILIALFLCAGVASASTPSPGGNPWDGETMPSHTAVTKSVTLVVKDIEDGHTLRAFDVRSEEELVIQMNDDVKIKARRKKDFDGRKRLAISDLAPGQKLKVTYRAEDGKILEVKILERA